MAIEFRTRRLVNPARKKRARNASGKKRRKLSPKQIAIFGTPAQKAALKRSRKRIKNAGKWSKRKFLKREFGTRGSTREKYANDETSRGAPSKSSIRRMIKRRQKRKKNIGSIISVIPMLNPGTKRKRRKVAKTVARRRRKNAGTKFGRSWSTYKSSKRRKKNPGVRRRRRSVARRSVAVRRRRRASNPMFRVRRVRRHARRNPGFFPGGSVVTKAIGFLAGAVGARYLTQLVLGSNNTGYVGYAANVAASVLLGMVTTKVTKSKEIGNTVLVGGIAGTILRVIFDKTQYGSFIQQQLGMSGRGGDVGIGIISDSSFFSPQVAQPGSMTKFITPRSTRDYVSGQVAQSVSMAKAGSPGMGMTGRRARGSVV